VHFDASSKAAPVVCDVTIRMVLILAIMANWQAGIVDVEGAFLQGRFQNGEQILMKIPNGFQKSYPSYIMLKLLRKARSRSNLSFLNARVLFYILK
jgi:hypothetical protein